MQMFTGPSCQEVSAVYLAIDAAYRLQKEYVNLSLNVFGGLRMPSGPCCVLWEERHLEKQSWCRKVYGFHVPPKLSSQVRGVNMSRKQI